MQRNQPKTNLLEDKNLSDSSKSLAKEILNADSFDSRVKSDV